MHMKAYKEWHMVSDNLLATVMKASHLILLSMGVVRSIYCYIQSSGICNVQQSSKRSGKENE